MSAATPQAGRGWPFVFGVVFLAAGLILLGREYFFNIRDVVIVGTRINLGWLALVFGAYDLWVSWKRGKAGTRGVEAPPPSGTPPQA